MALEVSHRRQSACEAMCLALGARAPCEAARLSRRRPVSNRKGQSPALSARVAHHGAQASSWASIAVQYWILVLDGGACAACELRACGRLLAALSVCLH